MPQIFRAIRRKLLQRQRIANYSLYALGEIVLVVVGILIALQINNWNDRRQLTAKEHGYLRNLRADLVSNIDKMETFLSERRAIMEAAFSRGGKGLGAPAGSQRRVRARGADARRLKKYRGA